MPRLPESVRNKWREGTTSQYYATTLLLVEEGLRQQLAAFRAENLAARPVEGQEEVGVAGNGLVPVRNRAG
jgi:hypothetical protein